MKIQLSEHFTYKKLIKFTIPTIIMMIFTSIYGVVDGIFISNCVGSDAFASVNLIMPVLMILGTIGFMVGTGGSALVSKTIGEGKKEKANEYFSMLNYFLVAVGFILTIVGLIFIRPISELLGAKGDMLEYCVIYGRVGADNGQKFSRIYGEAYSIQSLGDMFILLEVFSAESFAESV